MVALSSAEANLYAVSRCAQHALHIRSIGEDFGIVLKPVIRSDASAALGPGAALVDPARGGERAYDDRRDSPADALTKFLSEAELERHMSRMSSLYKAADMKVKTSVMECRRIQDLSRRLQYFNKLTASLAFSKS